MSDKIFLDTNLLIYAYSIDEVSKRKVVETILAETSVNLSTQVINEFINVMSKKRKIPLTDLSITINELVGAFYIAQITISTIQEALSISKKYHYSYYDSLIIASALESDCTILYTEDMHDQQIINDTLKIVNPFS